MKIKVLSAAPEAMRLLIEETEPAYANALRRVLVADVPKMAIEDVEFHLGPIRAEDGKEYESVSPLFDEMIAHRLGLIPIPTDLGLYNRRADCPNCHGEGCPNCTIIYSVNKRGPGLVTSADLEPIGDTKLRPADLKIPIVKLGDGQAMLVYATAILGDGKDHAKWQSTHGVGYRYYPIQGRDEDLGCLGSRSPLLREPHAIDRHGRGGDPRARDRLQDVQEVHGPIQGRVGEGRQRSQADRDGVRDGRIPQQQGRPRRGVGHPREAILGNRDPGRGSCLADSRFGFRTGTDKF